MSDGKDELANWTDMWEKAQEKGIFPSQPELIKTEEEDNAYWAYYQKLNNKGDDEQLLSEDHAGAPMRREDLADQAKDMGKVPNPVYHHTLGNDQDLIPWTPNWIDGKELEELAELKKDLYDLECELNAKEANAGSSSSVESKIESMKKKLHDLSNALCPDRFKEILD